MASSSSQHHHHPTRHQKTATTAPTRILHPPMATANSRKGPGGGDPAADHRSKDRRRPSPTMAGPAKTASHSLSAAGSPDKPTGNKSTPNYLRPTASSRHDPAAKKPTTTAAAPSAKKLARIMSMEHHPSSAPAPAPAPAQQRRMQPSRSLKETTPAKPAATTARTAPTRTAKASPAVARPVGTKARSLPKNKKKEAAPVATASASVSPRGVVLPDDHLDELETMSEPDVVAPTANLTLEDEDLVYEHVDHAAPDQPTTTTTTTDVDPRGQMDERVVHASEQKQQREKEGEENKQQQQQQQQEEPMVVEEIKKEDHSSSSSLGRPKTFSHHQVQVIRSGGVDDELQRKLMKRQAWEVDKDVGSSVVEEKVVANEEANKSNAVAVKKEGSSVNNVIEEATSKLIVEKKKNKVLALVGAFETVMSLQEQPETPSHARAETPRHGQSAFEREIQKQEEEEEEEEEEEAVEEASQVVKLAEMEMSNDVRSEEGVVAVEESGGENAREEGAQTKVVDETDQEQKIEEEKSTEG